VNYRQNSFALVAHRAERTALLCVLLTKRIEMAATIYDRLTGSSLTVPETAIVVQPPSVVVLTYGPDDVAAFRREGLDLILQLHNGRTVRIANFYQKAADGTDNELVLQDDDGTLWHGTHGEGLADF